MIKIGLKANAAFLFGEMKGDTLGGSEGGVLWRSILHLTQAQFEKFQQLIRTFGGDHSKSLTKTRKCTPNNEVDYECYFVKTT